VLTFRLKWGHNTFGDTTGKSEHGMEVGTMRFTVRASAPALFLAFLLLGGLPFLEAAPAAANTPERLVRDSLEAEVRGHTGERNRLLAEALAIDPNYAPARWHSGHVRIGEEWVKIDEVPKRTAGDEQLAAYRKRRDAMVDTADNHRELARWCKKNRLPDEQRVHWAKVLEYDPQDAEALSALGLQLYNGRLMTRSQIEKEKTAAGARLAAMRTWQPKLLKLRGGIERGSEADRAAALETLEKLNDPAAIPALEAVLSVDGTGEKVAALNRALVETVGHMTVPEATQVLLRRAVFGEPQEVRDLAIAELKKRPMHAYVPQLIASFPGKLKTKFSLYFDPAGTLVRQDVVEFEDKDSEYCIARSAFVAPPTFLGRRVTGQILHDGVAQLLLSRSLQHGAYVEHARDIGALQQKTESFERTSVKLTNRLRHVLFQTTGFADAADPQILEREWNDYNDTPSYPAKRRYASETAIAVFPTVTSPAASCFPQGTSVLTMAGSTAIEDIKIGDRVLSQHPLTGELGYKSVVAKTLRPRVELLKLAVGSAPLLTTRGHPFWVVGKGWRIAKFIESGDRLCTLAGTVEVTSIDKEAPTEAYNLVVDDWHNYFVGEQRLLAHDNSPLEETATLVPGLPVQVEGP
jgi:hypothetical protein